MMFYKMSVLEEEKKPYFKGEKSTKKGYMYSRDDGSTNRTIDIIREWKEEFNIT